MLQSEHNLLVGSYTNGDVLAHRPHAPKISGGVSLHQLDRNGQLTSIDMLEVLNPAVIVGPVGDSVYYAASETIAEPGSIHRLRLDDKSLSREQTVTLFGRSTCDIEVAPSGDAAIVVHYWDGVLDVVDIEVDGSLGEIRQTVRQGWDGVEHRQAIDAASHAVDRQGGPHPHGAYFWQDWVFVPDLGEDAIFQYRWDAQERRLAPEARIALAQGSGPRQMVIRSASGIGFVSGELDCSITTLRLDPSDGPSARPRATPVHRVVISANPSNSISELQLSPDERFLLVANRGDDTITTFAVEADGQLTLVGVTPTGGQTPRHFVVTPCGGALVVANQDAGELRVFSRDRGTGIVAAESCSYPVPAPAFICVVGPHKPQFTTSIDRRHND